MDPSTDSHRDAKLVHAAAIATEMIAMNRPKPSQQFSQMSQSMHLKYEHGNEDQRALMEENIISITHLTEHQIIDRLEQQRLKRLQKAGANLKCNIMLGKVGNSDKAGNTERCPKCTLPLPCKHFESLDALFCFKKSGRIFQQQDWTMVDQKDRDSLILKKLQHERDGQFRDSIVVESADKEEGLVEGEEEKQVPESVEFQSTTIDPVHKNLDSQDDFLPQHLIAPKTAKHSHRSQFLTLDRDTHLNPRNKGTFRESERIQKQQLVRRLRDDTFLRRLQLHTIKNQAASMTDSSLPGHLTGKDRRLIERQIVETKMEQVINTDRFSDLAGLDEKQLLDMLKREKIAEIRCTKQNYQPWEGMTHANRKEFIERLLIQHKKKQLEDCNETQRNASSGVMGRRRMQQQNSRYNTISKY